MGRETAKQMDASRMRRQISLGTVSIQTRTDCSFYQQERSTLTPSLFGLVGHRLDHHFLCRSRKYRERERETMSGKERRGKLVRNQSVFLMLFHVFLYNFVSHVLLEKNMRRRFLRHIEGIHNMFVIIRR